MHQVEVLPLAPLRKAKAAYNEWKGYMEEMRDSTKESLQKGGPRNDASILGKRQQCINQTLTAYAIGRVLRRGWPAFTLEQRTTKHNPRGVAWEYLRLYHGWS